MNKGLSNNMPLLSVLLPVSTHVFMQNMDAHFLCKSNILSTWIFKMRTHFEPQGNGHLGMAHPFIYVVTKTNFPTSSAKVADPTGKPNDLVRLSKFFGLTPSYNKRWMTKKLLRSLLKGEINWYKFN